MHVFFDKFWPTPGPKPGSVSWKASHRTTLADPVESTTYICVSMYINVKVDKYTLKNIALILLKIMVMV